MSKEKCTQDAIQRAIKLKSNGVSDKDIAAALCVNPSTFSRWVNHPKSKAQNQLSQQLKKAEADYKSFLLNTIAKSAQTRDWKAAAWLLERKYPQEYGRVERRVEKPAEEAPEVPEFIFDPEAL